jgi:DNA invertase Pin-like site-specific DNA recombinase
VKEGPKTAIVYCRTSTAGQKEAETIQAQVTRCHALRERHGVKLLPYGPRGDGWLVDDGVSGSLLEGRVFAQLVDDLRARRIRPDYLVVYSLSRICRIDKSSRSMEKLVASAEDAARIKAVLLGAGVKVIDEDGINDPATVMFDLKTTLAAEEYKLIQSRTTAGKAQRLANGSASMGSRVPFGYAAQRIDPKDKRKGLRWVPHPEQADQLRQLLAWYIKGGSTYAARKASEAGFPIPSVDQKRTKKSKGWTPTTWGTSTIEAIKKRTRMYLGTTTLTLAGEPYTITYEPLVDSRTFAQVERRTRERTLKHRAVFISTGYLDCTCGAHVANASSGRSHYARCSPKKGVHSCGSIPERSMSTALWSACLSRLVEIKKSESAPANGTDVAAAIDAARGKLSAVQGKLLRLAEMREDGLDRATWKARNDALNQSLALAQAEVDRLVREREVKARKRANEESILDKVGALLAALVEQDPPLEKKRAILADLLQGERVRVSWAKRTGYGTSPGASITFPAFGSLPPMTRSIDVAKEEYTYQHGQLTRALELQRAIRDALAS